MKEKNREYYTVGTVPKSNGTNHRNRGMTAHCPGLIGFTGVTPTRSMLHRQGQHMDINGLFDSFVFVLVIG
jgi:hypothetical protein